MFGHYKQQRRDKLQAAQRTPYTHPQVEAAVRKVDALLREVRELHLKNQRESELNKATILKVEGLKVTAEQIQKMLDREGNGGGEVNADVKTAVEKLTR
jgi:hypothetical protein